MNLAEIADIHNLAQAFHSAAKGKRGRADVEAFRQNLDQELAALRAGILDGTVEVCHFRSFNIRDPKPRIIHAPVFGERVLHHAIMVHAGPALDRKQVFDSYACRLGKGALAAVQRVREHAGHYAWYTQIDIAGYFAHIDHDVLLALLDRTFKDRGLLTLLERIVRAHCDGPGRGLPIGALTSQCFANAYLSGLDRLLLRDRRVRGMVRYMDDVIWWTDSPGAAQDTLAVARDHLRHTLHLQVKDAERIARSHHGIMFCGYRVSADRLLLTRRRKRRYRQLRRTAEVAFRDGRINATVLQADYASALSLTLHADAVAWRRAELQRAPVAAGLDDV